MFYHFRIHKNSTPYWAECVELSGCMTQAETMDELYKNMEEALNLYLNEPNNSPILFPLPKEEVKEKNIVKIPVDPKIAFSLLLRQNRLKKNLSQEKAANILGLKSLNSYQKLESSKNVNLSLNTIIKLKKVFRDFSVDKVLQVN